MINNKPVGPNPEWSNRAQEKVQNVQGAEAATAPAELSGSQRAEATAAHIGEKTQAVVQQAQDAVDGVLEGAKQLFLPDNRIAINKKLPIFGSSTDPKALVEGVRTAKGLDQAKQLLGFQKELDEMSPKQLDQTMDYIVEQMADDQNLDDPLLGALAKAVMDESSSRGVSTPPRPHWPHIPRPLPVKPELLERLQPNVLKRLDQITYD